MNDEVPPVERRAREGALRELARLTRRLPSEDFDRDVRPRLGRLSWDQLALVEQGLLALEAERRPDRVDE